MFMQRSWLVLSALSLLLGGCASSLTGDSYSRGEARHETTIRKGVVESVRYVKLEGTKSGVGAVTGGAVGGIAGGAAGHGRGSSIAAVLGAVTGGLLGAAAEEGVTRQQGIEITVQLDDGSLLAVVQAADEEFVPGEKIRLLRTGGTTRVAKAPK
jgi:outer membrane lipoprotein SlyB